MTGSYQIALTAGLIAVAASPLAAQCPDGTPPPCDVLFTRPVARVEPPGPDQRARSFLILPFRNVTRSPDYEWLVEGSPTLFADALGAWRELRLVPEEQLYAALRRGGMTPGETFDTDQVRRVAEETGGWTAVTGEVIATGLRVRVRARAYDVATERVVVNASADVPEGGDVIAAFEQLAAQLLATAGLDATGLDLSAATTGSLDAYKEYLRGLRLLNRSQYRSARAAFRRAIALDSTFAQAYARLAEASMANVEVLMNPRDSAYVYAQRAVELSGRLPNRDRQLLRAINAQFRGEFTRARRELEGLIASDSNDIDALEWLAGLELFDPIIVSVGGVARPRGSRNAAARLAKRVLALDPARHRQYANLVSLYLRLAGFGLSPGRTYGFTRERESLLSLLVDTPDRTWLAVLRDTVELIPADSAALLHADSVRAGRERAKAVAAAWVDRWRAAAPTEAEAHLAASRVYELQGDYDAALRGLAAAESLGVEGEMEDVTLRRVRLLGRAGAYADAQTLVDSLWEAGSFATRGLVNAIASESFGWVLGVQLLSGDFGRAEELIDSLTARVTELLGETVAALARRRGAEPQVPSRVLLDMVARNLIRRSMPVPVLGSLLSRVDRLPRSPQFRIRLLEWVRAALEEADHQERRALASRAIAAAAVLAESAQEIDRQLAPSFVAPALEADSTLAGEVASFSWYTAAQEERDREMEAQLRIGAATATAGSAAIAFVWRVADSGPWIWGDGRAEYDWTVTFELADTTFDFIASHRASPEMRPASGRRGTLADLIAALDVRLRKRIPRREGAFEPRSVAGAGIDVVPTESGMRMEINDPRFVARFLRERPATAVFDYEPCTVVPERNVLCRNPRIPVHYPVEAADSITRGLRTAGLRAYDGDSAGALRALAALDAAHLEVRAARMALLAGLGRFGEAAALADTLWDAGYLTSLLRDRAVRASASWAFALSLVRGDLARADTLLARRAAQTMQHLASAGRDTSGGAILALRQLAATMRAEHLDSLLAHLTARPRASRVLRVLPSVMLDVHYGAMRAATETARAAPNDPVARAQARRTGLERAHRAMDAALALADAGEPETAYALAQAARTIDQRVLERVTAAAWYLERWARSPDRPRFRPARAVVTESEARFVWTVLDTLPFVWNRASRPSGALSYSWTTGLGQIDGVGHSVQLAGPQFRGPERTGDLRELVATLGFRRLFAGRGRSIVLPMRVDVVDDELRIVVLDRSLVRKIRRVRPSTVRFLLRPCDPDPRDPRGSCAFDPVPVEYVDREN